MRSKQVSETDVLVAVALWLHKEGWTIRSVSLPRNQTESQDELRQRVLREFAKENIEIVPSLPRQAFVRNGPDIVAERDSARWLFECKGTPDNYDWSFGYGLLQTLRNRHEHDRSKNPGRLFGLGLAFPRHEYDRQLGLGPIASIRRLFDIWVFLYDPEHPPVSAIKPYEDIPTTHGTSQSEAATGQADEVVHKTATGRRSADGPKPPRPRRHGGAALEQTLSVIELVWCKGEKLDEATGAVATRLGISRPSVIDKYTRQFGLVGSGAVARFEKLLDDRPRLVKRVLEWCPNDRDVIRARLQAPGT